MKSLLLSFAILLIASTVQAKDVSEFESAVILKGDLVSDAQIFGTALVMITQEDPSMGTLIRLLRSTDWKR